MIQTAERILIEMYLFRLILTKIKWNCHKKILSFISTDSKKIPKSFTQNFVFSGIVKINSREKFDFFKFAKIIRKNHTSEWVISSKFAAFFLHTFSEEHLWRAASGYSDYKEKHIILSIFSFQFINIKKFMKTKINI